MALYDRVLLTVDFDRTLTAPDSTIPEKNIQAIRYFMEQGGSFTVNTGRSVPMFRKYMDQVPHNAPWLLYNGSAAYDAGVLSLTHPIPLDKRTLLEEVRQAFPTVNVEEQGVAAHYTFWQNPEFLRFYENMEAPHAIASFEEELGPFLKFSMFGHPVNFVVADLYDAPEPEKQIFDQAEAWLRAHYGDRLEIMRAARGIIDVHALGVSKNQAARALQKELGKEILVCVGDAENDLSMLQGADYAFCPADSILAGRFPTVCKCADGAVAEVILEKIPEILRNHT